MANGFDIPQIDIVTTEFRFAHKQSNAKVYANLAKQLSFYPCSNINAWAGVLDYG